MTELQEARDLWLKEKLKVCQLRQENSDLGQQVYELKMKLIVTEARAVNAEIMLKALVSRAVLG